MRFSLTLLRPDKRIHTVSRSLSSRRWHTRREDVPCHFVALFISLLAVDAETEKSGFLPCSPRANDVGIGWLPRERCPTIAILGAAARLPRLAVDARSGTYLSRCSLDTRYTKKIIFSSHYSSLELIFFIVIRETLSLFGHICSSSKQDVFKPRANSILPRARISHS